MKNKYYLLLDPIDGTTSFDKGGEYTINLAFCVQDEAASVSGFNYVQELGSYIYNNVYHVQPTVKSFTYEKLVDSNYDTRVHNSDVKSKNGTIDNWLRYQPINYIDCDSKYG